MTKIIYISSQPLTKHQYENWHIKYFLEKKVTLEYWDLSEIMHFDSAPLAYKNIAIKKINSYSAFNYSLKNNLNKKVIYFSFIFLDGFFSLKIYRLLSKYKCKVFKEVGAEMPIFRSERSEYLNIFQSNAFVFIKKVFYKLKLILFIKLHLINKVEGSFIAAEKHYQKDFFSKKNIYVNHYDYDKYLLLKDRKSKKFHYKYAVFLDLNLPFQTDLSITAEKYLDPASYHSSLNNFFEKIESYHSVKVVIAAHYKTDMKNNLFRNRICIQGLTGELVKNSLFVISHHSSSISFPILFNKPIIFIYTNEMKKLYFYSRYKWISEIAHYLGNKPINIDKKFDLSKIFRYWHNSTKYEQYIKSYLTTNESNNKRSESIILKYLQSVFINYD